MVASSTEPAGRREGLPPVMAVAHQEAGIPGVAEEDSGPVAREDSSRPRAVGVDLHRRESQVASRRPSDVSRVEAPERHTAVRVAGNPTGLLAAA